MRRSHSENFGGFNQGLAGDDLVNTAKPLLRGVILQKVDDGAENRRAGHTS